MINLSFTLPVSQAQRVVALVQSFNADQPHGQQANPASRSDENFLAELGTPLQFTPVLRHQERQELRYLLEGRSDLQKVVRFIVESGGKFFNDELGAELGHQDSRDTFSRLGHITRKLRKAGIQAEGFRGANWYSKVPSSGRTLITVREDVLLVLAEALGD